jgi:peroxiredoxin Q/BCP
MKRGDLAPDFELPDTDGAPVRLSTLLRSGPVAVFFYPLASSGGCTAELCGVRDRAEDFAAAGAQRIGISRDSVAAQRAFAEANGFDFPLLSDADGTVCEAYGVRRGLAAAPVKRRTVVIGTDGVVVDVVRSELRMGVHVDGALKALR